MAVIDLNADLGEGGTHDAALMTLISSANIACGGHAGNDHTMRASVDAALAAGVAIGAHPGYEDPEHFGRRPMDLAPADVTAMVARQLERLLAIHPSLHHVKPHGALYNQANADRHLADAVVAAIQQVTPGCLLYAPPAGALADAAAEVGLPHCAEGFIDRLYLANGSLCPRNEPDAVIHDLDSAVAQALDIVLHQRVIAKGQTTISMPARTLCIHSDSPGALALMQAVRDALEYAGIHIAAP